MVLASDPVSMRGHHICSCYVPYIQAVFSYPILLGHPGYPIQDNRFPVTAIQSCCHWDRSELEFNFCVKPKYYTQGSG